MKPSAAIWTGIMLGALALGYFTLSSAGRWVEQTREAAAPKQVRIVAQDMGTVPRRENAADNSMMRLFALPKGSVVTIYRVKGAKGGCTYASKAGENNFYRIPNAPHLAAPYAVVGGMWGPEDVNMFNTSVRWQDHYMILGQSVDILAWGMAKGSDLVCEERLTTADIL
jgi:hypothetical protein